MDSPAPRVVGVRQIGERVIIGIAILVLLTIGAATIDYLNTRKLHEDAYWVAHSNQVLDASAELLSTVKDAETGQRGYLITGNDRYLKPYQDALADINLRLAAVKQLTADNPSEQDRIARIESLTNQKMAELAQTVEARRTQGFDAAQKIVETNVGQNTMDELRAAVADMRDEERGLLAQRQAANDREYAITIGSQIATATLALAAAVAFIWLLRRHLLARMKAADVLREQREWFHTTLSSIGDAVIATDAQGRVTFVNAVAEKLTGWSQADAAGQLLPQVFHIVNEQSRQPVENPVEKVIRSGTVVGLANHTILIARDGRETPIDDSGAPIRLPDGPLLGVVLVFRDFSEYKQHERERNQLIESERAARTEAETASRTKDEFVATLSHELRTPLNAILGWSRLIEQNPSSLATVRDGIQVITRNAQMQAELIADLLDMSRIISGKLRLNIEAVNLSKVVTAGIDAVRHSAQAKGIQIEPKFDPDIEGVRGDAGRLQQVVWNLLSNAVKFTSEGGIVRVAINRNESHVQITVSDTGIGIRPELRPHLFERFRQGDASAARQQGGLGLGLAIVKHLVELHGGHVSAQSPGEGQGAIFCVELPIQSPASHDHDGQNQSSPQLTVPAPLPFDGTDLTGITVVAIDDQPDSRELFARILAQCRAQVFVASSGEEGLKAVKEHRPDVILCDIGMPGKDGYEFIRDLRSQSDRTPALAVTAFARPEDRLQALRAGFQGHIAKPVEPAELIASVAAAAKASTNKVHG